MKTLKQLAVAALFGAVLFIPSKASAVNTVYEFTTAADTGTPVQVCTGAACSLYNIEAASTTIAVGDGIACYSSATTAGYTSVANDGTAAAPSIGRITVLTAGTPLGLPTNNVPRGAPNGIVCMTHSSSQVRRNRWHVIFNQ